MKLLYGHTDIPIKMEDIYQNLVVVTNYPYERNIVIGNNYKNEGVIIEDNFCVLPAVSGKIGIININLLSQYFPKGYITKDISYYGRSYNIFSNFCHY